MATVPSSRFNVDIEFQNISYTVPQENFQKPILSDLSGSFQPGQLSAILGPSGCGKTTLLNILAGYRLQQTHGRILINGRERNPEKFRDFCCYIMQENYIQPTLSVKETMMFAISLKLGKLPESEKLRKITAILNLLGLTGTLDTRTEKLSGGQQRRLCVGLELISNPAILILDEPSTGLDEVSSKQCIATLKRLAQTGRTIICTIHTPSATLFSFFDHAFFMSNGQCVYRGPASGIVPYLEKFNIVCPVQYNPVDFFIEICNGCEEGASLDKMAIEMKQARVAVQHTVVKSGTKVTRHINSTWQMFKILIVRIWLMQWRNRIYYLRKNSIIFVLCLMVGILYFGIGQDATRIHYAFILHSGILLCFCYIPCISIITYLPAELKSLKREYFNKWYELNPYFFAVVFAQVPEMIFMVCYVVLTTRLLTGFPLELYSVSIYLLTLAIVGKISETIGFIFSSMLNITNSVFLVPAVVGPAYFIVSLGWGERYENVGIFSKVLMRISYLREAVEVMSIVTLQDRVLECPEEAMYCLYEDLNYLINYLAMEHVVIWHNLVILVGILMLLNLILYYLIKQRLNPNKFFKAAKLHIKKLNR